MSIPFSTTLFVSKIERTPGKNFAVVSASTSRKDTQNEGKYLYSNWYVKLLGHGLDGVEELLDAYENGEKNEKGFLTRKFAIECSGTITNESYKTADGDTVYKNPQVAVFEWSWPVKDDGDAKKASAKKKTVKKQDDDEEWLNQ